MKTLNIKISRKPELIAGIEIKEGINWLLIQNNPVDYVLDGFTFVNKKFIKKISTLFNEEDFEFKVLNIKFKNNFDYLLKLDNYNELFSYFNKTGKLIELELESSEYCMIGKVKRENDKSFVLDVFSTKGEILREENFKYSIVRSVNVDTDYLKSLEDYLNKFPPLCKV